MEPADVTRLRVLIHAPIGRDAPASADLLTRTGLPSEVCRTLGDLVNAMSAEVSAVVIAEEGLFGRDLDPLYAWVAGQPPWSDLPFIILTSQQQQPAVVGWRQKLVEALQNVSLLERPVHGITLTTTVHAAVRARQRQHQVRALLQAREQAAHELEALVAERTQELETANAALHRQMREREQVEEALRQAQKIEALGQLTGGIAHDFNNLLMVISGGLDMLDRQTDPRRRQRLMSGMRRAAQRGASLTRQLLAFSRRQPLSTEAVDLPRQIGKMRDLLDRSLRGDINVRLDFTEDVWPVEVDAGELELVILNLAVNARDALPMGGTIVIAAENAPALCDGGLSGDFVRLSVTDTGVGIPAEVRARVFDPFFTTKEVGKGSGLGLAQVHGFATQSGGAALIESEPGQGTTVSLLLPRSAKTPVAQPREPDPLDPPDLLPVRAGHVLLVEDDEEVGALVSEMLTALGYEIIRANSAAAALGALADNRPVDVVFSDIMMPGEMNGIDLAREVRRRRPDVPILLTSGHAATVGEAAHAEGVRLLPKPYQLQDLGAALQLTRLKGA